MPKHLLFAALLGTVLLLGCDTVDTQPDAPQLVVEAFLFTVERVNYIRISEEVRLDVVAA